MNSALAAPVHNWQAVHKISSWPPSCCSQRTQKKNRKNHALKRFIGRGVVTTTTTTFPSSSLWGASVRRAQEDDENVDGGGDSWERRCHMCTRRSVSVGVAEAVHAAGPDSTGDAFGVTKGVTVDRNGATSSNALLVADRSLSSPFTGGAYDFRRATKPLTPTPLQAAKTIVLVRHGLSSWNEEGRVQGSSDLSLLSEKGKAQAQRVREAIVHMKFEKCFASPISRAKTSAEIIWEGRDEPLIFLDTLREANLMVLEGMRNVDAKEQYPELYRAWREDPKNFNVNGVYPVVDLWDKARNAWEDILAGQDELVLVVTHKSILRALICTALGMGPDRFRAIDVHNAGVSTFTVNTRGEPMLQSLNMTAHLHVDGVHYLHKGGVELEFSRSH
ncbi:unnamed protein product [Sphagnum troendelagicum]